LFAEILGFFSGNEDPVLAALIHGKRKILAALSPPDAFERISVTQLLCGVDTADWRKCAAPADNALPPSIHYPMLFVGVDDADSPDYFTTEAGAGPGVLLQASYTLALLNRDFCTPVPWWLQLILAALFVVLLEQVLRRLRKSIEFSLIVSISAILAADLIVVKVLTARQEYLVLWIPLAPIFLVRYGVEHWRLTRTAFSGKRSWF
jgi:hypothetical protein